MKFLVALAALALLGGCGAELDEPGPTPPAPPAPPSRLWGLLGALGAAAENATERLRESALALKLQSTLQELRDFHRDARGRLAQYGEEARALLELSVADLRARGAAFARKLRKRLSRDQEELKKRWDGGLRALWAPPETPQD